MTFSLEQIRRARELARERRKHSAIQRLLIDEFNLRPAQCRALLMTPPSCVSTDRSESGRALYCIQQEDAPDHWIKDLYFKMEVRAYLRARFMSRVKACSYRVVDQTTNDVKAIVRDGQDLIG